tara:strand:- start:3518 stop:3772 length:255 start_codon:yes stop_codon:yes gene_type:complete
MAQFSQAGKMARNIVKNHGRAGLRTLLEGWAEGEDNATLARDLKISRERVRQYKLALVDVQTIITPRPGVYQALGQSDLFGSEE